MIYKVAQRYARALFELAAETNELESVAQDMDTIDTVLSDAEEIVRYCSNPTAEEKEVRQVIETGFKPTVSALTWKFLTLLVAKKRFCILEWVPRIYQKLFNDHFEIIEVELEGSYAMGKKERKALIAKLQKMTNKKVFIDFTLNSQLLGGFRLTIGETLFDCSIAGKLRKLRKDLLTG